MPNKIIIKNNKNKNNGKQVTLIKVNTYIG